MGDDVWCRPRWMFATTALVTRNRRVVRTVALLVSQVLQRMGTLHAQCVGCSFNHPFLSLDSGRKISPARVLRKRRARQYLCLEHYRAPSKRREPLHFLVDQTSQQATLFRSLRSWLRMAESPHY